MQKVIYYITYLVMLAGIISCSDNNNAPSIKDIQVPITTYNFYQDFSKIDTHHIEKSLDLLKTKYPDFINFYLDTLAVGLSNNPTSTSNAASVKIFLTHSDYRNLLDTVNIVYPNTEDITQSITTALKYAKAYDDSVKLPNRIFYFVSGLNDFTAITRDDKDLGIGLDYFLGENFGPYFAIGKSTFNTIKFTKENIPVWAMKAIYGNNYFETLEDEHSFIEKAIAKGKEIYYLSKVLPETALNTILGYTKEQMNWAEMNQKEIYGFFKNEKFIFDKSMQLSMKYLNDGPFSSRMPPESPGNIGTYLGFKIVEAYMQKTDNSLLALLKEKDNLKIFNSSKYKP